MGMRATAAGCGSSVGKNFGKECYKVIVNAGYRGKVGVKAPKFTYTGTYNVRKDGVVELLTSGTIVFLEPKVIDLFMVGGGGAGGSAEVNKSIVGCGGGGGGYTHTVRRFSAKANSAISVTIGAGAIATNQQGAPGQGGASGFGNYSVRGGYSNPRIASSYPYNYGTGAQGGSGGGGGRYAVSSGGEGGSDGANGIKASGSGGSGQGVTTREFGANDGKLYAGGGGGGTYISAQSPVYAAGGAGGGGAGAWASNTTTNQAAGAGSANTGGGGGGGACGGGSNLLGGSGGSGIVCFREALELPELSGIWVLNETLYPAEVRLNEIISFTAGSSLTSIDRRFVGMDINPGDGITMLTSTTSVTGYPIYRFTDNKWTSNKFKYIEFPSGATASEEFHAWLASNATKQ